MSLNLIRYLLCFLTFAFLFNPYYLFYDNNIGDDASYVAHTFTMAYDADLNYCNEIAFDSNGCAGIYNRTAPPHPAGIGIVNLPLTALFSVGDKLTHSNVLFDRQQYVGSFGYLGMFLSVSSCFLLGLLLYKNAINSIDTSFPSWFILLILSSYGISFYVFQRFTMNHAQEFFIGSFLFWLSIKLVKTEILRELALFSLLLPLVICLSYLIRPVNFITAAYPLIIITAIADRDFYEFRLKKVLFFSIVGILLSLFLIAIFNHQLYGFYFPDSTQMYGFEINRIPKGFVNKISVLVSLLPNIRHILFSNEFGLWLTSTLIFVGLFLLLLQMIRFQGSKKYLLLFLVLIVVAVPVATVLLWQTVASSYAYRYLFNLVPLAMLGIVLYFQKSPEKIQIRFRRAMIPFLIFGVAGQVFFMSIPSLTSNQQVNVFGKFDNFSVNGYHLSLAKAMFNKEAWKNVIAKRLPGFLYIAATDEATIQHKIQSGNQRYEKVLSYKQKIKTAGNDYIWFILIYSLAFPYLIFRLFLYQKNNCLIETDNSNMLS